MTQLRLEYIPDELQAEVQELWDQLFSHDAPTAQRAVPIADLVVDLAHSFDLQPARVSRLYVAALLHDIGKLHIAPAMLSWPGELDNLQWEAMKAHTEGLSLLSPELREFLEHDAEVITSHHEYFGGRGYPTGMENNASLSGSQMVGVASAFVAMTSDASYREAFSVDEALTELREETPGFWNPAVVYELEQLVGGAPATTKGMRVANPMRGLKGKLSLPGFRRVRFGSGYAIPNATRRKIVMASVAALVTIGLIMGVMAMSNGGNNAAQQSTVSTLGERGPADLSYPPGLWPSDSTGNILDGLGGDNTSTSIDDGDTPWSSVPGGGTNTTARSGSTNTTGTRVTSTTRPQTTTTTRPGSTTTVPSRTTGPTSSTYSYAPGSFTWRQVSVTSGCRLWVAHWSSRDASGRTVSHARTWIGRGDACTQVRTYAVVTNGGTSRNINGPRQSLGSNAWVDSPLDEIGQLSYGVSLHYVNTQNGGCYRVTTFADGTFRKDSGARYCP